MPQTLPTRRFNVDEYYRMAEAGILAPGERVELIEGEIIRMAAIGSRHAGCVNALTRLLVRAAGERALISVQNPVRLSELSEPRPDLAVLRPRQDEYRGSHPGPDDVLLIIEVADTTADFDREVKAALYAAAQIPEYWLVDIPESRIEVRRSPEAAGYAEVSRRGRQDRLRPAALPGMEVDVEEILS